MKEYPHRGGTLDGDEQATKFMPFAGTEGYNPVAYAPCGSAGEYRTGSASGL